MDQRLLYGWLNDQEREREREREEKAQEWVCTAPVFVMIGRNVIVTEEL
jgi:hypothetical protein